MFEKCLNIIAYFGSLNLLVELIPLSMTNSINEAVQNTFSELDKGLRGVVTTIEDNIDNILFELSTSTGSISFRVIYTNKKVTVDLVESTITDLDVSMIILQKLKTLETHEYIPGYFFIRLKSQ